MVQVSSAQAYRQLRKQANMQGYVIGFIHIGSKLHAGHVALIQTARASCDKLVVHMTNEQKTQTPDEQNSTDTHQQLTTLGVDVLFTQDAIEMFADKPLTRVTLDGLGSALLTQYERNLRDQENTNILRLLNIVQPDKYFIGEKSVLRRVILEQMTKDLCMPIEVIVCPTVREKDGLAVSAENAYLTPIERAKAPIIQRALLQAESALIEGERDADCIRDMIRDHIKTVQVATIDVVDILDGKTLQTVSHIVGPIHVAVVVRFGKKCLIDGFTFSPKAEPLLQW